MKLWPLFRCDRRVRSLKTFACATSQRGTRDFPGESKARILISSRFNGNVQPAKLQSYLCVCIPKLANKDALLLFFSTLGSPPKGILLSLFVVCITKGKREYYSTTVYLVAGEVMLLSSSFRIRKASLNVAKAVRKVPPLCLLSKEKGPEIGSSPPSKSEKKTLMKRMKETAIKKGREDPIGLE